MHHAAHRLPNRRTNHHPTTKTTTRSQWTRLGMVNAMYPLATSNSFPSPYSQHWYSSSSACRSIDGLHFRRPNMFPFVFPPGYPFPSNTYPSPNSSSSSSKRLPSNRRVNSTPSDAPDTPTSSKSKKSHIKKPLNAFMLFMREQRAQVVQECTLRESAAINQILGRKVPFDADRIRATTFAF